MSVKVLMPKPTLFDYLIPGLINLKSKRFISTGLLTIIILFFLFLILFNDFSNSYAFCLTLIGWFYVLNYFVCKFQSNNKKFVPDFISQLILFYLYVLILVFIVVFITVNPNIGVIHAGKFDIVKGMLWLFILLPITSFMYYFEMSYGGFDFKDFAADVIYNKYIESSATTVRFVNFILKAGPALGLFLYIGIKLGGDMTLKKYGKYLKDFNNGKIDKTFINSLKTAYVLDLAYLFIAILSVFILFILYNLK